MSQHAGNAYCKIFCWKYNKKLSSSEKKTSHLYWHSCEKASPYEYSWRPWLFLSLFFHYAGAMRSFSVIYSLTDCFMWHLDQDECEINNWLLNSTTASSKGLSTLMLNETVKHFLKEKIRKWSFNISCVTACDIWSTSGVFCYLPSLHPTPVWGFVPPIIITPNLRLLWFQTQLFVSSLPGRVAHWLFCRWCRRCPSRCSRAPEARVQRSHHHFGIPRLCGAQGTGVQVNTRSSYCSHSSRHYSKKNIYAVIYSCFFARFINSLLHTWTPGNLI